jgi:hypothetical protein
MIHLTQPKHSEPLIATEQGWVVERTGELLVCVKGLKTLIGNAVTEDVSVETEPAVEVEPEAHVEVAVNTDATE